METLTGQKIYPFDWVLYSIGSKLYLAFYLNKEISKDPVSKYSRSFHRFVDYDLVEKRFSVVSTTRSPNLKIEDPSVIIKEISKEEFLFQMKDFLEENHPELLDFLDF